MTNAFYVKYGDITTFGMMPIEKSNFLNTLYEEIGCSLVDAVTTTVTVNEKEVPVTVWVDDEGLYKPGNIAVKYKNELVLLGNIVVTGDVDSKGDTILFDDEREDYKNIFKALVETFIDNAEVIGYVKE